MDFPKPLLNDSRISGTYGADGVANLDLLSFTKSSRRRTLSVSSDVSDHEKQRTRDSSILVSESLDPPSSTAYACRYSSSEPLVLHSENIIGRLQAESSSSASNFTSPPIKKRKTNLNVADLRPIKSSTLTSMPLSFAYMGTFNDVKGGSKRQKQREALPPPFFHYRDFSHVPDPDTDSSHSKLSAKSISATSSAAPAKKKSKRDPSLPSDATPDNTAENASSPRNATFPIKMHAILSRSDLGSVVCWMPHGRSWRILCPHDFELRVIPAYFSHSKFASFVRQTNGWGFRRITQGPDRNSYFNELFLRGMPHLSKRMRRPGAAEKRAMDPSREPYLGSISELYPLPPPDKFAVTRDGSPTASVAEVQALVRVPIAPGPAALPLPCLASHEGEVVERPMRTDHQKFTSIEDERKFSFVLGYRDFSHVEQEPASKDGRTKEMEKVVGLEYPAVSLFDNGLMSQIITNENCSNRATDMTTAAMSYNPSTTELALSRQSISIDRPSIQSSEKNAFIMSNNTDAAKETLLHRNCAVAASKTDFPCETPAFSITAAAVAAAAADAKIASALSSVLYGRSQLHKNALSIASIDQSRKDELFSSAQPFTGFPLMAMHHECSLLGQLSHLDRNQTAAQPLGFNSLFQSNAVSSRLSAEMQSVANDSRLLNTAGGFFSGADCLSSRCIGGTPGTADLDVNSELPTNDKLTSHGTNVSSALIESSIRFYPSRPGDTLHRHT